MCVYAHNRYTACVYNAQYEENMFNVKSMLNIFVNTKILKKKSFFGGAHC